MSDQSGYEDRHGNRYEDRRENGRENRHENRHESSHENPYTDLHDAFGAEVADLEIGATPVGAVLKGGTSLRTRRRLTAVSGVAALAVLPVAAVTLFAGGTGAGPGPGPGPTTVDAGLRNQSNGSPDGSNHNQVEPPDPAGTGTPTPGSTFILPQLTPGQNTRAPNTTDAYTVVAGGTVDGKHWRLVRDLFVVPDNLPFPSGLGSHLPISEKGKSGTTTCDYTGLQWGGNPPGTQPDFDAGGQCSADVESERGPLSSGMVSAKAGGLSLWSLIGRVDSTKVATVSVTIGAHTTARQPISPVPGENDGYYVVFLPALSDQDQQAMKYFTTYDAGGHVVEHVQFG
jgi:hypothetical protein